MGCASLACAANTLLAVSLFNPRRDLSGVRRLLHHAGVDETASLAAAIEGARIRREIRASTEEQPAAAQTLRQRLARAMALSGLTAILMVVVTTSA